MGAIPVAEVTDPADRQRIVRSVLGDLPDWFGIDEANEAYVRDAAGMTTLATGEGDGVLLLRRHGPAAAEIWLVGVRRERHRQGVGRALVAAALGWCRIEGVEYLQVKTLAPLREDAADAAARAFYEAMGFVALEVFPHLWDDDDPALQLVLHVACAGGAVQPAR